MATLKGPRKWAYQAFRALPAPVHRAGEAALTARAEREVRALRPLEEVASRLVIGPLNTAGQAQQWASAARTLAGVDAVGMAAARRSEAAAALAFAVDWQLSLAMQLRGATALRDLMLGTGRGRGPTHVVSESGRAVLGGYFARRLSDDLPDLAAAGIGTALLFHGSEIRDPLEHAARYPHSPFAEGGAEADDYVRHLRQVVAGSKDELERFVQAGARPVFVSTPDLLDAVPEATWLPLVVDVDGFATQAPVLERPRPVVLHAPSNPRLKGTVAIETALTALDAAGVVEYRRLQGVPHGQMAAFVADADVVVDQVVLGNPGVLLAEAMSAGRVAVAHLPTQVRERMAAADPEGEAPPVVEATPVTVGEVVEQVVAERTTYQQIAARGPAWARRNHDGRRAAEVLGAWLR